MLRIVPEVKLDLKPLQTLKRGVKNRILRKAIRNGAKEVRSEVKSQAPRDTGALKTSISTKIVTTKAGVSGIIGPRSNYMKRDRRPVRYAHIVEKRDSFLAASFESKKAGYVETVRHVIESETAKMLAT